VYIEQKSTHFFLELQIYVGLHFLHLLIKFGRIGVGKPDELFEGVGKTEF